MLSNKSISVIIPTYNSSKFIIRTLDTVFNQTVLPDEIILTDDGSTDETVKLVNEYVLKKNNIIQVKILTQENLGAGAARNKCIVNATSDWIAFLDSDDLWDKTKIEKVKNAMQNNSDIGIITHDEYLVYDNNWSKRQYCNYHSKYRPDVDLFFQLFERNLFSTSCMVIKRELIMKAGLFDVSLRSAQDYDLWIRLGKFTKCMFISEALSTYVMRKDNITSNTYRRYQCEMRIVRKYKEEILGKYNKAVIQRRIFNIHKLEGFIALKRCQIKVFLFIFLNLPKEILFI